MSRISYITITAQCEDSSIRPLLREYYGALERAQAVHPIPWLSTHCYTALDENEPRLLITYHLDDAPQVGPEDLTEALNAGIKTLATCDKKEYRHISTRGDDASDTPAPICQVVTVRARNADVAALNAWYEDEHLGMMSQVPGWIRTRRFELVGGGQDLLENGEIELLAVYDFEAHNGLGGDIHLAASRTPGTAGIRKLLLQKEGRVWRHHSSHQMGARLKDPETIIY